MKQQRKPNQPKDKKPASQYDKIFKENIEAIIPGIITNLLHINVVVSEEVPDDIQHTKERKPDVLKKITNSANETFILQLEFQVADEAEMVYRMAEYYVMLRRKFGLPVQQYVLFVGAEKPRMLTRLQEEQLTFDYNLIVFAELDYQLFLTSEKPEDVVLAILADFKQQSPETVVRQVIDRIDQTAQGDFAMKRYFQQLRILAQLRNLQTQIDKTMYSIADYFSEEKDVLYIRGQRKAKEAKEREVVRNLLKKANLSVEQIADIVEVPTAFVLKVKNSL
ncbi:hypothetical protein [Spirosoma fluviale]|uniref:Transposase (putative) YhgA-like domain-containing protein n=1 Tax=Spirosoma fluviale TaxID=1597977 RepID=A0A286GSB8_9BACT|nr:hypothetical protein [Spirosoma fluviale]SOD98467.1 hypothetical protein SAMN06269250_6099 [Spirosoma fluviale]